jgi:hypothetical protein
MYLLYGFDSSAQGNAWVSIYQQECRFAFSRDHDDWERLRKITRMNEP